MEMKRVNKENFTYRGFSPDNAVDWSVCWSQAALIFEPSFALFYMKLIFVEHLNLFYNFYCHNQCCLLNLIQILLIKLQWSFLVPLTSRVRSSSELRVTFEIVPGNFRLLILENRPAWVWEACGHLEHPEAKQFLLQLSPGWSYLQNSIASRLGQRCGSTASWFFDKTLQSFWKVSSSLRFRVDRGRVPWCFGLIERQNRRRYPSMDVGFWPSAS